MFHKLPVFNPSKVAIAILALSVAAFAQDPRYVTKLAPYVASPGRVVDMMLEMAHIKPGEVVYDVGSGDGRILIAAVQNYRAKAVGIEISPRLVEAATEEIQKAGIADKAKVINGDALKTDFSEANVVTLYMDTDSNAKLRPQLDKLKPGSRVVSHDYEIPGWKPTRIEKTVGERPHTIYLYELPAARQ